MSESRAIYFRFSVPSPLSPLPSLWLWSHKVTSNGSPTNICRNWTRVQMQLPPLNLAWPLPTRGPSPQPEGAFGTWVWMSTISSSIFWKLLAVWVRNSVVSRTQYPEFDFKRGAGFRVHPWPTSYPVWKVRRGEGSSQVLGTGQAFSASCATRNTFPKELWQYTIIFR